MDDNIIMEPCSAGSSKNDASSGAGLLYNGSGCSGGLKSWRPSHILDFSNMSIGNGVLLN